VKAKLRAMANDVPVSANGNTYQAPGPIDPKGKIREGSTTEFVIDNLKGKEMTSAQLVEAAQKHFSDRKPENVKWSVEDVLGRLEGVERKDGKFSLPA
jgi:hypothetical protein